MLKSEMNKTRNEYLMYLTILNDIPAYDPVTIADLIILLETKYN